MNIDAVKMIELLCGIGSIEKSLFLGDICIGLVSDRRSAVLLVKGKFSKLKKDRIKSEKEKEFKIYVIFIPTSIQVLAKIVSKMCKSKMARIVREITEKVIIEVAKKVLVDYVLSKIPDRKKELRFAY